MPYKDPEKAKAAKREYCRRRYNSSLSFRLEEAERKAEWYEENAETRKPVMREYWHRKGKAMRAKKKG